MRALDNVATDLEREIEATRSRVEQVRQRVEDIEREIDGEVPRTRKFRL